MVSDSSRSPKGSPKKPIIAMKGGKTPADAKAARLHTSSLAANDAIIDAVFRQAGIIRAYNYMNLVNYVKAFVFQQPPKSNWIGIITPSGGLGVMRADACQTVDLDLAAFSKDALRCIKQANPSFIEVGNPCDIWPSISRIGTDTAYNVAFESLIEDKSVDAILAGFGPAEGFELKNPEFIFAASKKHPEKPIVTYGTCDWKMVEQMRETFEKNCIPMYYSPEEAAQALAIMYRCSRIKSGL